MLGMALIGSVSLWRAYHATMRYHTGAGTKLRRSVKLAVETLPEVVPKRVGLVEWRLLIVSEQVSAVAMVRVRSLLRAPESKMALLAPLTMVLVFGSMFPLGRCPRCPRLLIRLSNLQESLSRCLGFGS